eukprot:3727764-Pyramimonas_sp.AAC.1
MSASIPVEPQAVHRHSRSTPHGYARSYQLTPLQYCYGGFGAGGSSAMVVAVFTSTQCPTSVARKSSSPSVSAIAGQADTAQ